MPTGYTAGIEEGITFKEFVLGCACSRFYDCSDLPEKFTISNYHKEKFIELEREFKELESMNIKDAYIRAQQDCDKKNKFEEGFHNGKVELKKMYKLMLKDVMAWEPPSKDHIDLKKFMIEQLNSSIEFDCGEYPRSRYTVKSGKKWLEGKKAEVLKDIAYHREEYNKECERVEWKNKYITQLRESLS
jgi:hypothetical protein